MGQHDNYGKRLFRNLLGERWDDSSPERSVDEAGVRADLDGVIRSETTKAIQCAVEIEAKIYKQIRGAILDLALHFAPKKLLVIILAQSQLGTNRERIQKHFQYVWEQGVGCGHGQFELVCFEGNGDNPMDDKDMEIIALTLKKMNIL